MLALIAAGAVWGWASSRPAPLGAASRSRAAPREHRLRPGVPAALPPRAERESEAAAACISPEVAAYYDGALHVAAADEELERARSRFASAGFW